MTDASLRPYLPALRAVAARASRVPHEAEDLLQDALLAAVRAGRTDFSKSANLGWMMGTLQQLGTMHARSASRRRLREDVWSRERGVTDSSGTFTEWWRDDAAVRALLVSLPPSLRRVAELALSGHHRGEIAWALGVSDVTLRQRIAALRRRLAGTVAMPDRASEPASVEASLALPVGLIRRALLPVVTARPGIGAQDPDGHLLVLAGPPARPVRA